MSTAKSIRELKRSLVVGDIMMSVLHFLFIFLGALLFIQFDGAAFKSTNNVMIRFIGGPPTGLVGLLLVSLLAIAMSSMDSLLNSMSTVFTENIYERYIGREREASLKTPMMISAVWGTLVYIITMLALSGTSRSILAVIGNYISYISGPTCGIFLSAILTKEANDKGMTCGAVVGFIITLLFRILAGFTWIWDSVFDAAMTFLAGYVFSCPFGESAREQARHYTVRGRMACLKEQGRVEGSSISLMSFAVGRYSMVLLVFSLIQLAVICFFQQAQEHTPAVRVRQTVPTSMNYAISPDIEKVPKIANSDTGTPSQPVDRNAFRSLSDSTPVKAGMGVAEAIKSVSPVQ